MIGFAEEDFAVRLLFRNFHLIFAVNSHPIHFPLTPSIIQFNAHQQTKKASLNALVLSVCLSVFDGFVS